MKKLERYIRTCACIGNIPSSYIDAMSYEEQILWLCKFLDEKVLPVINQNSKDIEDLQKLDLQDEVNKKLEEMAEDGTLQEIMAEYLNVKAIFSFNNIDELKQATNLINGSFVETYGYNSNGDGGQAKYKVRTVTNLDDIDDIIIIALHDENLVAELVPDKIMSAKQFGALNNDEDQSVKIKKALDYCISHKIETLILNGEYYISEKILMENINNLSIINGTIKVHETSEMLENGFNIFEFKNSSNIIIDNVKFIEINPEQRTRNLYVGGIKFDGCNNCRVINCYLENVCSGIIFANLTKNSIAENNVIITSYQSDQFSQSAIIVYGSSNNIVKNNKIYGEYYDGTLSIYGANTIDCLVDGNELHNIYGNNTPITLSQGITIDSGVQNCICTNNIVYDMFYGIDNKSDTRNTLISNNTLIGNKISIADRSGENVGSAVCFNTSILNNKIVIREDYDTSTLGIYDHYGKYYFVGILCGNRSNIRIKNNDITLYGNITKKVLGIGTNYTTSSNQYLLMADVSNNNVEFSTGHASTTSNAPSDSTAYSIQNILKGNFNNNTFKVDTPSNTYTMYELRGNNENIIISNNNGRGSSYTNHSFIKLIDDATIKNSHIYNNLLYYVNFDNNLNSITNIVEQERFGVKGRRFKETQLIANTWTTAAKIKLQYNGVVQVKIQGLINYGGIKNIDCMYNINVNNNAITVTELYNRNTNFDFQFINEGTSREISVQAKTTHTLYLSDVFITEFVKANENTTISDVE